LINDESGKRGPLVAPERDGLRNGPVLASFR
jgi:hypothetical protein